MLAVIRASRRHALPAALLLFMTCGAASGQTTAFTYQGQLSDGGSVANGSYDLRFALFAADAGGAQIGTPQSRSAVAVSGGVFTVQLDFGVNAFPGANRFLEIGVKPAGGASFTTLAPRQQISSSPYAIRTLSAATADALSSACVGCVQSAQIDSVAGSKVSGAIPAASVPTGSGNYIQNTTTPQAGASFNISGNGTVSGTLSASKVEIAAQDALVITGFQPFLTFRDANDGGKRALVSSGFGDLGFYTQSSIGGVPTVLIKNVSGNMGIGNTTPQHRVTVSGGPAWTNLSWGGALALDNAAAIGWQPNTSGQSFGIGQTNGGLYVFRTTSPPGMAGSTADYALVVADSGNVGVGVAVPTSGRLQADGGANYSGVYATTAGNQFDQSGVYGGSSASNGTGVTGEANVGASAYGVWGKSQGGRGVYGEGPFGVYGRATVPSGWGVYSEGHMRVVGNVYADGYQTVSDRNVKANFTDVEPGATLRKLISIPIQTWNFRREPETVRHLGPMAQDFHAAFDLGEDDRHISTLDADGVALAAIQDLNRIVEEKNRQLEQLQGRVQELERQIGAK